MFKERKNLRKVIAVAICLAGSVTLFAQETGVVINGVTWATRNVGAPKTFVANPEDVGMFYQWNSKIGWTSAVLPSDGTSTWNGTWNGGGATSWETANDPSPDGWRVPTKVELDKLFDATKVDFAWTTENGINGGRFTDKTTTASIFLPTTGLVMNSVNGNFTNTSYSYLWSGTENDSSSAFSIYCFSGGKVSTLYNKACGISIRPVKNSSTGINEVSVDTENAKVTGYFDILGRKLTEEPTKGIYIIQYDNGKTKKIMK